MNKPSGALLPADWNPKAAADQVLRDLVCVTAPQVKGAHDAEFVIVGGRAYIVAEVNDERAGESADWPFIYVSLTILDLASRRIEKIIPFARSGQAFANETLPAGACFVPRIIQRDSRTLRCFFASEAPGQRQAQTYFLDFDLERETFSPQIQRAKLKTSAGVFPMQPQYMHADAARQGFARPARDFGLYIFDSFKEWAGRTYIALNNFAGAQNALATLNAEQDTFEVVGHYNGAPDQVLTESAVNRLPDGTWLAICRQEAGDKNYLFTTSRDGRTWSPGEARPFVVGGTNSKPTFDRFGDLYYLGWQEATQIAGANRSVFNIDVSADGTHWERKYRFETALSFHYPSFHEHDGIIYFAVTQGNQTTQPQGNKGRIMFGCLPR